ncbi:hypothetical protein NW768_000883 [Fusarium equiseti]|uniref:Uncharacterized protein n=1 Tax=Fusarium equiseti TaxID=61235 RepID=A0ABQ8RUB2_FUSEQ|nr:hypothetical protein NW768_000883 [Fusarium equiseti]
MTHPPPPTISQAAPAYTSPPKTSNSSSTNPFVGIYKGWPTNLYNTAPINSHVESLPPYPSSKPSTTSAPVSPSKTAKRDQAAECNKRVAWVLDLFSEGKLEMAQTSAVMLLANQKGLTLYHRAPLFAMLALFPGGVKHGKHAVRIYKYLSLKHPELQPAYRNAEETLKMAYKIETLRELKEVTMMRRGTATADDVSHEHFEILYYNFYKNMHKEGYKRLVVDAFESESGSSPKPSVPSNDASDSTKSVKNAKDTAIPTIAIPEPSVDDTSVEECICNTTEGMDTVGEEEYKTVEEYESNTSEQDGYRYGEGRIWIPVKRESPSSGRQTVFNDESHTVDIPKHESPSKGKQIMVYNRGHNQIPRKHESPSKVKQMAIYGKGENVVLTKHKPSSRGRKKMAKRPHSSSSESNKDVDKDLPPDTSAHGSNAAPDIPEEQPMYKPLYTGLKGGRKSHPILVGHKRLY